MADEFIVCDGGNNTLQKIRYSTGELLVRKSTTAVPWRVAYSADNSLVALGGATGVSILSADTLKPVYASIFTGYTECVLYSPNGKYLAAVGRQGFRSNTLLFDAQGGY